MHSTVHDSFIGKTFMRWLALNSSSGFTWEGKSEEDDVLFHMVNVDEDYANTFKIELKEGNSAFIIGGNYIGEQVKIKKIELSGEIKEAILLDEKGNEFRTRLNYVYPNEGDVK